MRHLLADWLRRAAAWLDAGEGSPRPAEDLFLRQPHIAFAEPNIEPVTQPDTTALPRHVWMDEWRRNCGSGMYL